MPDYMMAVTLCPKCGKENSRTTGICSSCGARLPRMDLASPEVQVNVGELTDRFNQFVQATEKLLTEKWNHDDFYDFLTQMQSSIQVRSGISYSEEGAAEEVEVQTSVSEDNKHFQSGLEVMFRYIDEGAEEFLDETCLERALQIMREGNEKLLHGSAYVPPSETPTVDSGGPTHITCVLCGFENPPTSSICDRPGCGAKLPRIEQSAPETKRAKVTDRYDRFKSAVDRVRDGEWTLEDFRSFLEEIDKLLTAKRKAYFDVITESGYAEFTETSEEVDQASSGIEDYEKGLGLMWQYAQEEADDSVLDRALGYMWEGNEKLNKAMTLNRALRKELTEQFGYI